jgi:hypothetical protein
MKSWTEAEEKKLINMWNDHTSAEISSVLNRTERSIESKLRRLRRDKKVKFVKYEKDEEDFEIGNSLLEIIGIILYWCEGTKRSTKEVGFVNTDPKMIAIYMKFIRSIGIKETKLRARVKILPDNDEDECINFWSCITGIPKSQFIKSIKRKEMPKRRKRKLKYGTCYVRYYSTNLMTKIKEKIIEIGDIF